MNLVRKISAGDEKKVHISGERSWSVAQCIHLLRTDHVCAKYMVRVLSLVLYLHYLLDLPYLLYQRALPSVAPYLTPSPRNNPTWLDQHTPCTGSLVEPLETI